MIDGRRSAARDEKHPIRRRPRGGGRLDDDLGHARRPLEHDILIHRDALLGVNAVGPAVDENRISRSGGIDRRLNGRMIAAAIIVDDQCRKQPAVFKHFGHDAKMGSAKRTSPRMPMTAGKARESGQEGQKMRYAKGHQINPWDFVELEKTPAGTQGLSSPSYQDSAIYRSESAPTYHEVHPK